MSLKIKFILVCLLAVFNSAYAQDFAAQLDKAKSLYDEGRFLAAAQEYEAILSQSGKVSFEVYYNLGNAYFKADKLPQAILNYERAKKLNANNEDLLFNLEIANQQVVDEFEQVPELSVSKWYKGFVLALSSNTWAYFSVAAFIVLLIAIAFFLTTNTISIKKTALSVAIFCFIFSGATLLFASSQKSISLKNREAIIFAPNVTATSAPAEQSTSLFVLHEGTKVQVIEEQQNWVRIKISDGNIGWLPAKDVELI